MTRVTDLAQFNTALYYLTHTQQRVTEAQTQIASGVKSQAYTGMAPDASRLITLETTHARVSQYLGNNRVVGERLQTMENAVAQILDVGTELKTLLINALNNDNASALALSQQADAKLEHVAALLNTRLDGRYLFAGSRTDTAPVDLAGLPAGYVIPTADGDSIGYYQGDNFIFAVQADDTLSVNYGVTADETGFEQLIRAIDIVKKSPPTDRAALEHALAVVGDAMSAIPDIRTKIGSAHAVIDEVNKNHDEYQLYAERSIGDIQNVDVAEVMTKLNSDSVSLQASYMAINTLTQLNLMSFLR
jgi:flagellar hook-associated protein 3 FlgL